MKVRSGLQLVLALGLSSLCSGVVAAQALVPADGSGNAELAWLLGAVVLSFSVVARRSPASPLNPGPSSRTNSRASILEKWLPSGALR